MERYEGEWERDDSGSEVPPAALAPRFAARLFDLVLAISLVWVADQTAPLSPAQSAGAFLFIVLAMEAVVPGRSPGKCVFGLIVIAEQTQLPCNRLQAVGRNAALVLLPVLDWVLAFGASRRRIGDDLFDTLVVSVRDAQRAYAFGTHDSGLFSSGGRYIVQPVTPFRTVAVFHQAMDAEIVRARLDAEGISAFIADGNLVQTHALLSPAIGGAKIQVPETQFERALEIIRAIDSGQLRADY